MARQSAVFPGQRLQRPFHYDAGNRDRERWASQVLKHRFNQLAQFRLPQEGSGVQQAMRLELHICPFHPQQVALDTVNPAADVAGIALGKGHGSQRGASGRVVGVRVAAFVNESEHYRSHTQSNGLLDLGDNQNAKCSAGAAPLSGVRGNIAHHRAVVNPGMAAAYHPTLALPAPPAPRQLPNSASVPAAAPGFSVSPGAPAPARPAS